MPFTYEFVQYNTPGVAQAGGVQNIWRFTSDVAPFTDAGGDTHAPAAIAHDAVSLSQERSSGQVYVRVARDFPVAQLFRTGTPAGTVWLRIRDQASGALCYIGRVRSTAWSEAEAKMLLSSTTDMAQREGLRQYWQAGCGWALYSAGCTVDRDAKDNNGAYKFRTDGVVDTYGLDGLWIFSSAFATRPAGFFEAGLVELNGQRRMVVKHQSNWVQLQAPLDGMHIGDTFTVYKGCNRSSGAGGCADYGNTVNFQGCPNIKKNNVFITGIET
jgi:hypothetical protein